MTATTVNGLAVVDEQPTKAPITTPTGKEIFWEQVRELLLEDTSIAYGCKHCDFTDPAVGKVRGHLVRCPARPARKPKPETPVSDEAAVDGLLKQLAELPKLRAENAKLRASLERYKARCRAAESRLGVITKAIADAARR